MKSRPPRNRGRSLPLPTLSGAACVGILLLASCREPSSETAGSPDEPASTTPSAGTSIEWPLTRGGPTLSGRVDAPVPRNPAIEWTVSLESPGTAEAAVAEGVIVVGDVMGWVYCIDLETRKPRWKFETGDSIEAAPAIADGRVFVGSGDNFFYALDLKSGEKLWSLEGNDKFSSAANIVPAADGQGSWLLVNGFDGITRCLKPEDGSEVWTYDAESPINGTPALIDGRFVAFGGCDNLVHVLHFKDGSLANEVVTDSQITHSVATDGTLIYSGNYANQVFAADVTATDLLWVHEGGEFPFFTAPAVDADRVYIGCRDKSLHAVSRADGTPVWTFPTGARVESAPIVFTDGVVFGSSDGRLYAADPADGSELWRLDLGESLTAAPAFSRGKIVIAGGDGTLFVVGSASE